MESTLTTRLPLLPSPSKSRALAYPPLAGACRVASISFSPGSVHGFLLSRGGGDAGVTSSITAAAAAIGDAVDPASEAILLRVQPEVTSATVDFKEAKAVVWTTPEVKLAEDWQKQCGEKLASHLGTCGFESQAQGQGES